LAAYWAYRLEDIYSYSNDKDMKILFISLLLPHPHADHAMAFTIFHVIKHLSQKHEISLVAYVRSEREREQTRYLMDYCSEVETVMLPISLFSKIWTRSKLLALIPRAFSSSYCGEMRNKIRSMTRRENFDIVQMDYTMGQYISEVSNAVTIIYLLDLFYVKARRMAENMPVTIKKLEWLVDSFLCSSYEKKLYTRFDRVLTISPWIREYLLASNPSLNIDVLPPGVNIPKTRKIHSPGMGKDLVFMGAMWRQENIDAVMFFYRSVFGLVRDVIPDVRLHIVGGSPSEEIRNLASDPGVRVAGYVNDLPSYYANCDISIAPMRMSGGVHCKILDAMAAGLPVITTSDGHEGIGAKHDDEIIVADGPEEFAQRAVELLQDGQKRKNIGMKGLDFIRRNHCWEEIIGKLENIFQESLSLT
jgi:glycosyltransferase involved in cell wall biosynthesis